MSYVALKRLNPNHPVVVTLEVLLHLSILLSMFSFSVILTTSLDIFQKPCSHCLVLALIKIFIFSSSFKISTFFATSCISWRFSFLSSLSMFKIRFLFSTFISIPICPFCSYSTECVSHRFTFLEFSSLA